MISGNAFVATGNLVLKIPRTLATRYSGESKTILDKIIECESSGNPKAYNPDDVHYDSEGNKFIGSFGITQFGRPTFQEFCVEKYGMENDIWDPDIQIECAKKMIDNGLLNHWTCAREIE